MTFKNVCLASWRHGASLCRPHHMGFYGILSRSRTPIKQLNAMVVASPSQTPFLEETGPAFNFENLATLGHQCIFMFWITEPAPPWSLQR